MADILHDVINKTFTKSDFNGSGEATAVTTDANTSYVIKDVYVEQGSSVSSVTATAKINGFSIGSFDTSLTGSEIIPPSSTMVIKSPTFPLTYTDTSITYFNNNDYRVFKVSSSMVNGVIEPSIGGKTSTTAQWGSSSSYYTSSSRNYRFITSNDRLINIYGDNNSTTYMYVANASGNIYSHTSSYTPKAYDGSQYVYWWQNGYFYRFDTINGTDSENLAYSYDPAGSSSYARCCVSYGANPVVFTKPNDSGGGSYPIHVYKISDGTTYRFGGGTELPSASYLCNSYSRMAATWDAVNNRYIIAVAYDSSGGNRVRLYAVNTSFTTVTFLKEINASGSYYSDSALYLQGNKLLYTAYYAEGISAKGTGISVNDIVSYDINTDQYTVVYKASSDTDYQNTSDAVRSDFIYMQTTPSQATINSRTYTVEPSLKVRAVGVKSTS